MNVAAVDPKSGPASGALLAHWRALRDFGATMMTRSETQGFLKGVKLAKWERDPYEDETPREARARVARQLAEGQRCTARLLSGGPCSLLLPCTTHGR